VVTESYLVNLYFDLRKLITKCSVSDEQCLKLLQVTLLNHLKRLMLWTFEVLSLSRSIIWQIQKGIWGPLTKCQIARGKTKFYTFLSLLVSVVSLILSGKEFQAAGPAWWVTFTKLYTECAALCSIWQSADLRPGLRLNSAIDCTESTKYVL